MLALSSRDLSEKAGKTSNATSSPDVCEPPAILKTSKWFMRRYVKTGFNDLLKCMEHIVACMLRESQKVIRMPTSGNLKSPFDKDISLLVRIVIKTRNVVFMRTSSTQSGNPHNLHASRNSVKIALKRMSYKMWVLRI
ncbi:hypothetical protein TNCV_3092191 [Trichonephila clavipes]|uniref:Uncharacterized protein n=1 Tax=Trichonephila clavipes TaxID=2585209 RepID=A0A8X6VD66_TRICX|nr:hypothetical protein TNCV_3092191 [Trichonephila clavipes]